MGYSDVLHPMIVNVSRTASFAIENHLRRMCIVSQGGTTLVPGEFKEITSTSYSEIVKPGGLEVEKQLRTFFSYAGNKTAVVIEVGEGSLEASINTLKGFLDSEELRVFNILVPTNWFDVKRPDILHTVKMNQCLTPKQDPQKLNLELYNVKPKDLKLISQPTSIDVDLINMTYKLKPGSTIDDEIQVELQVSVGDKEFKIGPLKFNPVNGASYTTLGFSTTTPGEVELHFINLLTEYDTIDKENLFFLELPQTEDPQTSANFLHFKGLKSIQLVSNNTEKDTVDSAAVVMGITASTIFDISNSNPASPLNYKVVKSYQPMKRSKDYKNSLIQNAVTLIDTLAGQNVVLNGRQLDGQPWEYYYYWYLTKLEVHSKITTLLLNGANNPTSAVNFDQNGIDTIHANIVSKLTELQSMGVISNFSQSYDQGTGQFDGLNDIVCPNYYEFIVDHPEDYKNEILSGLSCYIQIGKFIRQVQWNVTLGV
mgnify:CR=1 FL=1